MSRPPAYARRVDDNHGEIRDTLKDTPGVYCRDVARSSGLGFDLIVSYQDGPPYFVEIKRAKDPSKLTASERRAKDHWGRWWIEATSAIDVLAHIGAIEQQENTPR